VNISNNVIICYFDDSIIYCDISITHQAQHNQLEGDQRVHISAE